VALGLALAIAVPAAAAGASSGARPSRVAAPAPYRDPDFRCHVQHYGNGQPPDPARAKVTPLCVDYNKRDITVDNGGALRFLAAEPARFAVAGKCEYWQQDHWRVRLDRGFVPLVQWDGSYWWDLDRGLGGAILRHFRIAGQPVGVEQAAALVAVVAPGLAKFIRRYGAGPDGGGGVTVTLPASLPCSRFLH
jgi:hypothetical protein